MTTYLSKKLTFFSFWLIILVVLLHSTINVEQYDVADNFGDNIQRFISFGLCQIAVPFFFIISGYLFFFKINKLKEVFKNIYKRKDTLLQPYIIWCIIWVLFIYTVQSMPFFKSLFGSPLSAMSWRELFMQIFYYPINYPFWFLRELIAIIFVTPILFVILKNKNIVVLIIIFITQFFLKSFIEFENLGVSFLSTTTVFYFSLGAYLGINKYIPKTEMNSKIVYSLVIIWFITNIIYTYNYTSIPYLETLKNFIGIVAMWQLYDFSSAGLKSSQKYFYNYSFFIFAFHGIPLNFIKKLLILKLPSFVMSNFAIYLFSFFTIVLISITLAYVLDKYANKIYKILTGSR